MKSVRIWSFSGSNMGKYGTKKLRIRTLFTECSKNYDWMKIIHNRFTQGLLQLLFSLEKSLNEHKICSSFWFSILFLNCLEELFSAFNFSKSIIFSLINHFFSIVGREVIKTYQVYYTILLIYQFCIHFLWSKSSVFLKNFIN